MSNTWTTHTDGEGNEKTEVHQLVLELVIIEVSKQVTDRLWTGCIMLQHSDDLIGKPTYDHDLEHCKVVMMVKASKVLQGDAKILADVMTNEMKHPKAAS